MCFQCNVARQKKINWLYGHGHVWIKLKLERTLGIMKFFFVCKTYLNWVKVTFNFEKKIDHWILPKEKNIQCWSQNNRLFNCCNQYEKSETLYALQHIYCMFISILYQMHFKLRKYRSDHVSFSFEIIFFFKQKNKKKSNPHGNMFLLNYSFIVILIVAFILTLFTMSFITFTIHLLVG